MPVACSAFLNQKTDVKDSPLHRGKGNILLYQEIIVGEGFQLDQKVS